MNKWNIKGMTVESVTGILVLAAALINAILQMFGQNPLPIKDTELSGIVSAIFLTAAALWNTWKNRNVTLLSQKMQSVADAVRNGELLLDDLDNLIAICQNSRKEELHE